MATLERKAFCVLHFVKHESVVSVQRAFRRQFNSDPPSPNSIRRWYHQFQTTGCLCKGKSAGRPRVSEESVERMRPSFLRSPKKYVRRASRELEMLSMTMEGAAKETAHEALPSSLVAASETDRPQDRSNFRIMMQ